MTSTAIALSREILPRRDLDPDKAISSCSLLLGKQRRLGAVARAELAANAPHMQLYGDDLQVEGARDLLVGFAAPQEFEHFFFARRQPRHAIRSRLVEAVVAERGKGGHFVRHIAAVMI